jgi:ABC-type phosphate transport system substrate-binding protein
MKHGFLYVLFLAPLFVFFLTTSGCTQKESQESPTRGSAVVAYAEDIAPLMNKERAAFEGLYSKAHITPIITSTREAVALLLNDSVHVIAIGRDLNSEERSIVEKYNMEIDTQRIAYDGVEVLVNRKNPIEHLTSQQLEDILSGSAKRWRDVGAQGYTDRIVMAFGGKNSSLMNYCIARYVNGHPLAASIASCRSTEEAIKYVQKEKSAIGFVTTSWVRIDSLPTETKLVTIGDPKFQRDSTATVLEYFSPHPYYLYRNYYPMRRTIYMLSKKAGLNVGIGFIAFVAGVEGQRIITSSGLLPATMPVHFVSPHSR